MPPFREIRCSYCHAPLDHPLDQRLGVCQAPACRGLYLQQQRRNEEAKQRVHRQSTLDSAMDAYGDRPELAAFLHRAAQRGVLPVVVLVPACDRPLVPLPQVRKAQFIEHLRRIVQESETQAAVGNRRELLLTEFAHRVEESPTASSLVVNACTTCRGYCCHHGGDTAFLSADFLTWRRFQDPQLTSSAIIAEYESRLPEEAAENSCVFHGRTGCTLDRRLRANICNGFHCTELMDAADYVYAEHPIDSIAVAAESSQVVRIGMSNRFGERVELSV